MRVADLFAGAGGLSLGFYLAGFELVCAIDVNPYRRETYTSNIKVERYVVADITRVDPSILGGVDVVVAGPPCRPYSVANRVRPGTRHPEYGLERLVVNFALAVKPKVVVVEEVLGKHLKLGRAAKRLRRKGYSCEMIVVNFLDFGVPQSRKRIILVASRDFDASRIFSRLMSYVTPGPNVGVAIGNLPLEPTYREEAEVHAEGWLYGQYDGVLLNHEASRHRKSTIELIKMIPPGYSLRRMARKGLLPPKIASRALKRHSYKYRRLDPNKPSPTLPHPRASMILHPKAHRILTVREVARLQAFPDWFKFKGPLDDKYRQVVDAVPPRFSYCLAVAILASLNGSNTYTGLLQGIRCTWDSWIGIQPLQSL